MSHDLRTCEGAVAYLASTQWACTRVERLSGGTSSWTWRVHLAHPVDGRATVVLKHVREYAALFEAFALSAERQHFEAEAIRYIHEINVGSWITIPNVLLEDQDNRVLVLSDCGTDAVDLKAAVLAGKVSVPGAVAIGEGLGTFLARLHNNGRDKKAQGRLAANVDAVRVSAVVTYGSMESILLDERVTSLSPPLYVSEEQIQKIRTIAETRMNEMASEPQTITHGDYWTGNCLVNLSPNGAASAVTVVDWELAKPGLPGLDVGQLCAELYYLERFSASPEVGKSLRHAFLEAYRKSINGFDIINIAGVAATHIGAHHVVWTPKISPWKVHPAARDVISQGIDYFVKGFDASPEWLRESLVGELLSS